MVDTGMNRLGLAERDLADPALAGLDIDMVMSHLASADEDSDQNAAQLARFAQVRAALPARRYSLANSAGIALGPRYAFDVTRPGLALYGGVPCASLGPVIRQVAFPQAAVLQVRQLSAGDPVGYNATFTAPHAMRSATVSIGYADGYLRCWSGRGTVQFAGIALPVIGRVSMDMIIVDCSAAPSLGEGDWVDLDYALPDAARISGLSQYELLTLMGQRLQRRGG
jgi:alanine racemase